MEISDLFPDNVDLGNDGAMVPPIGPMMSLLLLPPELHNETLIQNNILFPENKADLPTNDDDSQTQIIHFGVNNDVLHKNSKNIPHYDNDLHENNEEDVPENNEYVTQNTDDLSKNTDYTVNDTDLPIFNDDRSTTNQELKWKSIRSSSKLLPKFCVECNVSFKIVKEYEKHTREHHSDKKLFHCTTDDCDRSFTSRATFYMHRKVAHNLGRKTNSEHLFCRFCQENFDNYYEFRAHFKKSHPGEKKYKCEHCSRTFDIPSRKVQHEKDVHSQGFLKCVVCCKRFNRECHYRNHEKKCREKSKLVLEKGKKYECDRCGKIFNHRQYYMHMRYHKKHPPCPICGKAFPKHKGMDGLVNHIRWRHPEEFPNINIEELMENKGGKIRPNKDEQDGGDELEFDVDNETHETSNNVGSLEDTRESLPEHDEDQPIAYRQMINDECFLGQNDDHLLENTEYFTENVADPLGKKDGLWTNDGDIPTLNKAVNLEDVQELQKHEAGQPIIYQQIANDEYFLGQNDDYLQYAEYFTENVVDLLENNDGLWINDGDIPTLHKVGNLDVQELEEHDADQPITNQQMTNDECTLGQNDDYLLKNTEHYTENVVDPLENNDDLWTNNRDIPTESNVPLKFVGEHEKHTREDSSDKKTFRCMMDECDRSFTSRATFYKHRKVAHNLGRRTNREDLLCRFCRENFDNFHTFAAHFKKLHPGEKKYKCEHCPQAFDIPFRKMQHEKKVHLQETFKCAVCRKSFKRECHYQNHEKKCREKSKLVLEKGKKYECDRCGKILNHRQYYMHMKHHEMCHPCPICGMEFAKQEGMDRLVNHIRRHHPEEFPNVNMKKEMEYERKKELSRRVEQYEVDELEIDIVNEAHETINNVVGSLEDTRELLLEHDADHSNRRMINDERFLGQNEDHLLENTKHFTENVVDPLGNKDGMRTNDGDIPTLNKAVSLEDVQELQKHEAGQPIIYQQMANDEYFLGQNDDYLVESIQNFTESYSCEESSRVSSKLEPFCAECNKTFENIWDYVNHVGQSHANKKLFRCNVPGCGKRFTALSALYDHRTENHLTGKTSEIIGERVFICRLCGGEFRHFRQLGRHFIKRHPGEKKYKCKYCTETFGRKGPKHQHELKYHEDRYFECDVCRRTFATRWYLNRHAHKCRDRQSKEMTEQERMRECHLCRKKFILPRDQRRYDSHMLRYKKYPHCPVCGIIIGEKKSDDSNIQILVEHMQQRHPDEFPKINIKAVVENNETSVWKNGVNMNEENDVHLRPSANF